MNQATKAADISDREFARFQSMLYDIAGISLADSKKMLVVSRLSKRLREFELSSFSDYLKLLDGKEHPHELQTAVDLLTTNETYFFREQNHFTFLKTLAEKSRTSSTDCFRVWSAACSSGQEPYSIAMVLDNVLGARPWEIQASDISLQMVEKARKGQYPIAQADNVSNEYLLKYCLKGIGQQEGTFVIDRKLRERVHCFHGNLNAGTPKVGMFDVIFLRNVMIYFDADTKRQVVARLLAHLKPGGHFLIGHSESLNGINDQVKMLAPSIFRKP